MPTIQTEPKLPVVVAFEKWWATQKGALELSDNVKFAAWNGWLACWQQSRDGDGGDAK